MEALTSTDQLTANGKATSMQLCRLIAFNVCGSISWLLFKLICGLMLSHESLMTLGAICNGSILLYSGMCIYDGYNKHPSKWNTDRGIWHLLYMLCLCGTVLGCSHEIITENMLASFWFTASICAMESLLQDTELKVNDDLAHVFVIYATIVAWPLLFPHLCMRVNWLHYQLAFISIALYRLFELAYKECVEDEPAGYVYLRDRVVYVIDAVRGAMRYCTVDGPAQLTAYMLLQPYEPTVVVGPPVITTYTDVVRDTVATEPPPEEAAAAAPTEEALPPYSAEAPPLPPKQPSAPKKGLFKRFKIVLCQVQWDGAVVGAVPSIYFDQENNEIILQQETEATSVRLGTQGLMATQAWATALVDAMLFAFNQSLAIELQRLQEAHVCTTPVPPTTTTPAPPTTTTADPFVTSATAFRELPQVEPVTSTSFVGRYPRTSAVFAQDPTDPFGDCWCAAAVLSPDDIGTGTFFNKRSSVRCSCDPDVSSTGWSVAYIADISDTLPAADHNGRAWVGTTKGTVLDVPDGVVLNMCPNEQQDHEVDHATYAALPSSELNEPHRARFCGVCNGGHTISCHDPVDRDLPMVTLGNVCFDIQDDKVALMSGGEDNYVVWQCESGQAGVWTISNDTAGGAVLNEGNPVGRAWAPRSQVYESVGADIADTPVAVVAIDNALAVQIILPNTRGLGEVAMGHHLLNAPIYSVCSVDTADFVVTTQGTLFALSTNNVLSLVDVGPDITCSGTWLFNHNDTHVRSITYNRF